jgi:L-alanine-DL-glutamate epimerase-like enolase superfamily enzyme
MRHKISKVDVHLVSSAVPEGTADSTRKVETIGFVLVRITTDQGLEGIGVTYHEVGGEATRALIRHNMAPRLIGRDPLESEALWQEFFHYLRGVGRKGLSFCALSAIDIALWDLKGKIANLPVCRLLGGNLSRVPVYASGGWTSYDDDQLVDEMKSMVGRGFSHIKMKVGFGGGTQPNRDVERVRKVREAVGPDIRILIDANNCFDAASRSSSPTGSASTTSSCSRSRSSPTTSPASRSSAAAPTSRSRPASTSTPSSACATCCWPRPRTSSRSMARASAATPRC